MATVAVLQTDLILNSASFRTGMVQAAATANATLGSIRDQAASTASSLRLMSKATEGLFAFEAVKEGIGSLIEAQIAIQQIHYTLLSATGSTMEAGAAFTWLQAQSQKMGLDFRSAAQGFGQLAASAQASGVSMSQTKALFEAYGHASTVLHLSVDQSRHALLALTEMMSRGTINARQLNQQLGFAIPGSAARFKNAVMEAIKGTDLAGESFNQLMKSGKLVTAQFMPELIQALQQSGRGWQDAATGMNSAMHRLGNAWLNLKGDISGGLFDDTVTGGANALAANLQTIASSLGAIGALAGGAFIGNKLNAGVDKVSGSIAAQRAAQDEAAATLKKAEAEAADTAELVANREATVAGLAKAQDAIVVAKAQALADYQRAEATAESTLRNVEQQRSESNLMGFIRAHTQAVNQLSEAQAAATKAQVEYDLAVDASNKVAVQQRDIQAELQTARISQTAAIEAQTVAQEEQAATGFLATAGRGIASIGSSLMGLIGGPIGAAVIAVGALGYAFMSDRSEAQHLNEETQKLAKSTTDLVLQSQDLVASFRELGNADPLSKLKDSQKSLGDIIDANNKKIQEQRSQMNPSLWDRGLNALTPMLLSPTILEDLSGKTQALGANVAQLTETNQQLEDQYSSQQQQLIVEYGSAWKGVRDQFDNMQFSVDGLTSSLPKLGRAIVDAFNGEKAIDANRAALTKMRGDLSSSMDAMTKEEEKHGKTHVQIVKDTYAKIHALEAKAGSGGAPAYENAQEAADLKTAAIADSYKQRRSGVDKVTAAYDALSKSLAEKIAADQQDLAGGAKLTDAGKELLNVKKDLLTNLKNLSPLRKQQLRDQANEFVNLTNEIDARNRANEALRQESLLKEKLAAQTAALQLKGDRQVASVGMGTQEKQQLAAMNAIADARARDITAQGKLDSKSKASAEEHAHSIQLITDEYGKQQQVLAQTYAAEAAAQANWKNGASAAFANFVDSAANVAGATETLFTTAFNGMADALTTFATTGKLNFKSMVSSILTDLARMELRIVESKILTGILNMFAPAVSGGFSNSGALAGNGSTVGASSGYGMMLQGGRASGGPVSAGSLYQVNERGPELLTTGGNTYLMMGGQDGHVTPNGGSSSSQSGASPQVNVTIQTVIQSNGASQSQSSSSGKTNDLAKQLAEEVKGVVNQQLVRQSQPNGLLWKLVRGQTA